MQNMGEFSLLATLAALYFLVIIRFQSTPQIILFATIAFGVSYVLWGVVHHLRSKNFHAKIVLEYLLVALLGVAIISTLLV